MDRQKINNYFLEIVKNIIKNEKVYANSFLSEDCSDYENYICSTLDEEEEAKVEDEFNISVFHGASKLVIISEGDNEIAKNYVVKIPFGYEEYNYCEVEVDMYRRIVENYKDFSMYFAECWKADEVNIIDDDGFNNWIPIYIMRRADADTRRVENDSFHYFLALGGSYDCYCPEDDEETFNCFGNQYGKKVVEQLVDICDDLTIGDLHIGNVGFVEGKFPIFIDYSGYYG